MGRNNTESWRMIHSLCRLHGIEECVLYEKSKMLLSIYRQVCWGALNRADMVAEDVAYYYANDLDRALIYLETFAPENEREKFHDRIKTLFETRWFMELMDKAMDKVKDFPSFSKEYVEILSRCFLYKDKSSESEMLLRLRMERSRFYDRKKEAVMVFGLSLWTDVLPGAKKMLECIA